MKKGNKGKKSSKRKRLARIARETNVLRSKDKRGHGWAARQAARRSNRRKRAAQSGIFA